MLTFVFPGQGSQSVGMGDFLYKEFKICRDIFDEASEAINVDLKKLCFTGSESDLALTENTQPALLTVSTATARVLTTEFGIVPQATAGHSIGEYASFVLGSVISFSDAVKAVKLRGQAMQSAVPVGQGGMIATLGLNEEQVQFLCQWACKESGFSPLSPANFNCDGQIVISGNANALNWLKENFKPEILPGEAKRVKLIPLQVSAPFHCEMMKPAQDKMAAFFETIQVKNSTLPIVQNIHAKPETDANTLKKNIILQVSGAVKWTQTVQQLKEMNMSQIIECGNGSVLKGLFKKSDAEFFKVFSTNSLEDLNALSQFKK
ncbi:MAG: ACP S-malonyltransferase [Bdellovibrio sp.]|nr:ACP S-malonyltransferase [Bdellovibrio sp.]